MGALKRIDAKFGDAKIGGLACDPDVANEEAHMGDIDVEHRRLDIDRHVRSRRRPALNERAEGAGARADAAARLAAFLVADKGEDERGIDFDSRTLEGADRLERHADSSLQIARAPAPDGAVRDGARERALPLGPRPALLPSACVHGVGVTDQQERIGAAPPRPNAPHVGAPFRKVGG